MNVIINYYQYYKNYEFEVDIKINRAEICDIEIYADKDNYLQSKTLKKIKSYHILIKVRI